MQLLNKLRGMRFPDVYVVRMFFKEGLQHRPGRGLLNVFYETGELVREIAANLGELRDCHIESAL